MTERQFKYMVYFPPKFPLKIYQVHSSTEEGLFYQVEDWGSGNWRCNCPRSCFLKKGELCKHCLKIKQQNETDRTINSGAIK